MDSRTSALEKTLPEHLPTGSGPSPDPCARVAPQGGKVVGVGRVFTRTIRHFWPELNSWLQALPDTRFQPMVKYDVRFLCWWGLLMFCLKLGSRRQLDFALRDLDLQVLDNVNRLAQTEQTSLPVNKTLSHFLGHVGSDAFAHLRTECVRQLIRNKLFDGSRLEGCLPVVVDGTGFLSFREPHCAHCLVHRHETYTAYLHPVLEAKLVDPRGLAISMATEFIQNPTGTAQLPDLSTLTTYESVKQDCELKAFGRLATNLKKQFPQTRFCIGGDSLYACAPVMSICEDNQWSFILTFKEGRTPALWQDFQSLLKLSPENRCVVRLPDKTRQTFRWVNDLKHKGEDGSIHTVHALICEETGPNGSQTFAWVTDLRIHHKNVCALASQGRRRCHIENQGFNIQKNSGLNLEHAYSIDPDVMKSFYYLLQIAHLFLQMFEMGSLLQRLAKDHDSTPVKLFGSLKNMAQRLLECFRYYPLGDEAFATARCQIRLCDSG